MPIGLVVWDDYANRRGSDAIANGDNGAPQGREREFADLLRFIRDNGIDNLVWLTADVHYTAAHRYDPARAAFKDPIRTGDHTPMLLERFASMGWPKPAGQRLDAWRTALAGNGPMKHVGRPGHPAGGDGAPFSSSLPR